MRFENPLSFFLLFFPTMALKKAEHMILYITTLKKIKFKHSIEKE